MTATIYHGLYAYNPSLAAAWLFCILFAAATLVHIYWLLRFRTWYFIPFILGSACMSPAIIP